MDFRTAVKRFNDGWVNSTCSVIRTRGVRLIELVDGKLTNQYIPLFRRCGAHLRVVVGNVN